MALLTITNVFEVWVNARQPRRAFTASSVCKVRKLGWAEKSICSSWDSGVITTGDVLSTAQRAAGMRLSPLGYQWELWEGKHSDNSGALQVLSLLANLSVSLHPSITHLAATGTRKAQESLKPAGAHAWGCVWSNKEPSVCKSCSVSEHQLSSASAETGFSGRNRLWQCKWRWYHGELGLHEQPWTWPSLMPRPEQGSGSSSGISGEAAAHT